MSKRKRSRGAEPTMTIHTRAAMDDIYDIYNQPGDQPARGTEDDYDLYSASDGDYTSGGEDTTRNLGASEADDDDQATFSPEKSVSEWSDFTARKHIPNLDEEDPREEDNLAEPVSPSPSARNDRYEEETQEFIDEPEQGEDVGTEPGDSPPRTRTIYIPVPPEDYEAPTRPYRDPAEVANNRLPFMTPITERTESSLGVATAFQQQQHYDPNTLTPSKDFTPNRSRVEGVEEVEGYEDEEYDDIEANEAFTEPLSSPLREVVTESIKSAPPPAPVAQPKLIPTAVAEQPSRPALAEKKKTPLASSTSSKALPPIGPIITDPQCNPVDEEIRAEILSRISPALSSYGGFFDHRDQPFPQLQELKRWAKLGSSKSKAEGNVLALNFPGTGAGTGKYVVRKELGAGAFAPVYLVENSHHPIISTRVSDDSRDNDADVGGGGEDGDENAAVMMGQGAFAPPHAQRARLEALKVEQSPPSAWEFYVIRLAHSRLGWHERASRSITCAREMHLFSDASFLVLPFHPFPTVLEVVNYLHAEGMMEEPVAMFFAVELLRTVEALHARGVAHGDVKIDNCIIRLDHLAGGPGGRGGEVAGAAQGQQELGSRYRADGGEGWADRGIVMIDFGRGIDMRAFRRDVAFIADWDFTGADPVEMREGRPWTWQIDYHGLAGTLHCLLFGKYMDIARADQGGLPGIGGRRYRIKEGLKRYWQVDIWQRAFEMLLNPVVAASGQVGGGVVEEGGKMPLLKGMKAVRREMEEWLEKNSEKGTGLKGLLGRVEAFSVARTKRRSL